MRNVPRTAGTRLRSDEWFERQDLDGFLHRSWLKSTGVTDETFRGRPVIGICNSWSELVNCNVHLRGLAESVKRGVLQAGGFPLEFPVISLGESLMKPTTMLYRNLMAMDVEESIRSYPLDGVVLLTGCDKTNPASIMGAASADIPAIVVTGGPMLNGRWRGREIGSCSDCWHYHEELRAGRITEAEWVEIENSMSRSNGHCMTMGTASTMACVTEALGLTLPGGAAIPAVDSRRQQLAEAAGRQIVALVESDLKPSDILTRDAFENAIRVLHAISGSTNAILHLLAYAGRVGVELPLQLFDELCTSTPWLVDLKPAGRFLMEDFFYAGGVPGRDDADRRPPPPRRHHGLGTHGRREHRRRRDRQPGGHPHGSRPLDEGGALVVLGGNLCPDGAVMKISAAESGAPPARRSRDRLRGHPRPRDPRRRSRPRVRRVDASWCCATPARSAGPGMPEWGHLPIPAKLLQQASPTSLRISDARMSGTSYGAIVLHVAPESAVGGPLALVEDGDLIRLDVAERRLDVVVRRGARARRARWSPPARRDERGYRWLHADHVLQANEGCDFDFLRGRTRVVEDAVTYL